MKARQVAVIAVPIISFLLLAPVSARSAQVLSSALVSTAPVIDGLGNDKAWESARSIHVKDRRIDEVIILKAVHTDQMVFFLVQYPDASEDRLHKPWVWDRETSIYRMGPQREDTFFFKWNMTDKEVDLSNFSDDDYTADVWYWKANRTDPAGYADDKSHVFTSSPGKKAKEITSRSGKKRYLMRIGDEGRPAQKKVIATTHQEDIMDSYESVTPEGSRADVRAKGVWKDGVWTIEFGRRLSTGHVDDVQFEPESGKRYQFGASILSLYGEPIDNTKSFPYGQGRISETIYLTFGK